LIIGGSLKPEINPFFDQEIAINYEKWYQKEGLRADKEEKEILQWLINRFPDVTSIIEVGCGTGHFSRWFKSLGFQVRSNARCNEYSYSWIGGINLEGSAIRVSCCNKAR
jgi:hypothetical protein